MTPIELDMKKLTFTFILCFVITVALKAQEIEYNTPTKVDSLNSTAEESLPLYDPNNKTMFIVRTFHPENTGGKTSGNEIWAYNRNEKNSLIKAGYKLDKLNNKSSNAVVGIAENGKRIYLLNNYVDNGKMKPGVSTSELKNGKWSKPKALKLSGVPEKTLIYNVYVNKNEDIMLLSLKNTTPDSSYGVYISQRQAGAWGVPVALNDINKSGSNEISPYLSTDNKTLYFSSNRKGGKGDYDIYKAEIRENLLSWSEPKNVQALNSAAFDAYFSIGEENTAYFASNRSGGLSDIYLSRTKAEKLDTIVTKKVKYLDDAGNVISFHPFVNFAFDKYNLNKSAKVYLNAVTDSLKNNKKWKVQLNGHTDSIGSNSYNRVLSKNRALSTRNYLISQGISAGRIKINYYGEKRPKTTNDTDFGRYMNRRVEIKFKK